MIKVAILIDGSFFLKRYQTLYRRSADKYFKLNENVSELVAKHLYTVAHSHLNDPFNKKYKNKSSDNCNIPHILYRIFYYDCKPYKNKEHHPISKKCIDFSKTDEALFRAKFFDVLRKKRKIALRLGDVKKDIGWTIKKDTLNDLVNNKLKYEEIKEDDFIIQFKQVGIDMKIAVDIASMSYKKLVDKIVLISGDSDFVPASKIARREGIDFTLDPMGHKIDIELEEHIDGLHSTENYIIKLITDKKDSREI